MASGLTQALVTSVMSNKPVRYFDLIIVGAGLVGATLACAVAGGEYARNLRIGVIEAGANLPSYTGSQFDPRVVALTHASQSLLRGINAWDAIEAERVCAYSDMHVWDGEGTAAIHFSGADVRQDSLGFIVENSVAVNAVRQQLAQLKNIELIQPARVTAVSKPEPLGSKVEVVLSTGLILQADLLIAADGTQSRVRQLAQFSTREWDYGQRAIVTTVRTGKPHQYTAWQRFMHTGPLALLPLQNDGDAHYCSIVWSADDAVAEELMTLNDRDFCQRLGFAFEQKLGDIEHCAERFCIPLRQRHASQYIQSGIVLVGDAAHSIHPLAGQGVNLGLLDAAALANEIERALGRHIPLSDFSLLRRYQRQRLAGNLGMMSAMEGFKRLFGNSSLGVTWLRNTGVHKLNSLPLLKNFIVKQAMGL